MTVIAHLFPGQGSQKAPDNPEVILAAQKILGFNPFEADKIQLTAYAQPAILSYSVWQLKDHLATPAYLAGHSLGEYTALVAGGVLTFEEALKTVHYRGLIMQEATPAGTGGMLAVLGVHPDQLEALCQQVSDYVTIANYNGPEQTVLSGTRQGLCEIRELLSKHSINKVIPLPVSAPFHSALMKPAQDKLASYLNQLNFRNSRIPIVSNVTASPETSGTSLRDLLIEQVTAPVQFTKIINFLKTAGVEQFIEIGPGKTLTNLVRRMS